MADNEEKTPVSPIPRRTIRLKPINMSGTAVPGSAPAPAPSASSTDTSKLSRRTIKLVPQSQSSVSGEHPVPEAGTAPSAANTDTSKLSRRTIKLAPQSQPASAAPSAPTIKLSTTPSVPASSAAPSAPTIKLETPVSTDTSKLSRRTIKLVPQSGSQGTVPPPPAPAVTASAPAEQISTDTAKISRRTIKLAPQSGTPGSGTAATPSSPTIQLNKKPGLSTATIKLNAGNTQIKSAGLHSSPTIKLGGNAASGIQMKKPAAAAAETVDAPAPVSIAKPDMEAENTGMGIALAVSSAVALIAVGFLCFIMFAQYSNFFNDGSISVPGLEQKTMK